MVENIKLVGYFIIGWSSKLWCYFLQILFDSVAKWNDIRKNLFQDKKARTFAREILDLLFPLFFGSGSIIKQEHLLVGRSLFEEKTTQIESKLFDSKAHPTNAIYRDRGIYIFLP